MNRSLVAASLAVLLAACSGGQGGADGNAVAANETDAAAPKAPATSKPPAQAFADDVAATLAYEMTAGNLAQSNGGSAKTKAFGKRVFDDSVQASMKLKAAAAKVPDVVVVDPTLTPELLARIEALKGASGAAFDAAFKAQMVEVHDTALAAMMAYGESGAAPQLKAFAAEGAPNQRTHLYRAREL